MLSGVCIFCSSVFVAECTVKAAGKLPMRIFFVLLFSIIVSGCTTSFSTLRSDNSPKQIIYDIPEEQAFQIAFAALGKVLPGNEITDIDGPLKGYSASFRFLLDTYSQQVMVIPAIASGEGGKTAQGYYYEVAGHGSSIVQGRAKNVRLFDVISSTAKSTGKAVLVSGARREAYVGARWKQGESRNESLTPTTRSDGNPDSLTQIERLKQLRDQGTITEEEFQRKKRELLDRI